jgi:hypothetical protein
MYAFVKKYLQLQQKYSTNFNFFSHRLVACAFGDPNEVCLLGYQSVICVSGVEGMVISLLN